MPINRCVCAACETVYLAVKTFYPLFERRCLCGGSLETYRTQVHWCWERAPLTDSDLLLIERKEAIERGGQAQPEVRPARSNPTLP